MYILGISCYYHDAAATLIKDGVCIAASEEERFTRIKHDSSFPLRSINFCLNQAKITTRDIDYVVFYEKPFRKFHRLFISSLTYYPKSYKSFREGMRALLTQKLWIKEKIATSLSIHPDQILFTEHHISHAASTFYPSPFQKAAILTVDGVGEWSTLTMGHGENEKIYLKKQMQFPHSLGLFYSAYTAFLGFEVNEGEWKVMGLAPYGEPTYKEKILKTIKIHNDGSMELDLTYFSFQYSDKKSYTEKLTKLLGHPIEPKRSYKVTKKAADIAASIQSVTEDILVNLAKTIKKETNEDDLCLAGGVALNSVANYRILNESGFKNIFIQPAAGDSGGALGCALYVYHHMLKKKNRSHLSHVYYGKKYEDNEIEQFLTQENIKFKKISNNLLTDFTTDKIKKGKVIGWMQGRFEWGPRALGNRSILADARKKNMKKIINEKVKFREEFRPFAPSVLGEKANTLFTLPKNPEKHHPLRYMLYVVPVKNKWREKVPAINHIDNTARPQLVFRDANPLYHDLLSTFYKKTGVPLILNTSFNLKGEPIVASPSDAYSTFKRSGIDVLAIGNYICQK